MPMEYHTLVGDIGTGLSGGQKQRILLARALYKNPKMLVSDEATSHLDLWNEQQVNAAIQKIQSTRIIVAHRPETIAMAQRVVVLQHGAIVQDVIHTPNKSNLPGIDIGFKPIKINPGKLNKNEKLFFRFLCGHGLNSLYFGDGGDPSIRYATQGERVSLST